MLATIPVSRIRISSVIVFNHKIIAYIANKLWIINRVLEFLHLSFCLQKLFEK